MAKARVISIGGVDYEVRPLGAETDGFEIWRDDVTLGGFVVEDDGTTGVRPGKPFQFDEIVMWLVAEAYRQSA